MKKGLYQIKETGEVIVVTTIPVKTLDLMCDVNVRYHKLCKDLKQKIERLVKEKEKLEEEKELQKKQIEIIKIQVGLFLRGEKHVLTDADFDVAFIASLREDMKHGVSVFIYKNWSQLCKCYCDQCTDGVVRFIDFDSSRKSERLICAKCYSKMSQHYQ